MKTFRELEIFVNQEQSAAFISCLEENLTDGWKRNFEAEENSRGSMPEEQEYYYFTCSDKADRKAALVALIRKTADALYISNIIPTRPGNLTEDEYNLILNNFYEKIIKPTAQKMDIKTKRSKEIESVEDWLPEAALTKLRSFLSAANRFTGSHHAYDQERWFDFLLTAHRQKQKLDSSLLRKWLVEDEKWPETVAEDLAHEYSFGMKLLEYTAKESPNDSQTSNAQ